MKACRTLDAIAAGFTAWLIFGAVALAQQSSIEVRTPAETLITTAPDRIITTSVVVANRGADVEEIVEQFALPPGCQRVAPPELPFRLAAGDQAVRVLAILVPKDTPAGRFDFRYAAQSRRDPSSSGSTLFTVHVTPVNALELIVEPRPDFVLAGDAYPVKLRVFNRGNSRISAQLTARSTLNLPVKLDAAGFTLEAAQSREFTCTIQTDQTFAEHTRHAVTFQLAATSATGETLTARQASVVELIPRVSGARDPFHYLPMQLKLSALSETDRALQFQAEISGTGSLDEAGKHRVDFLLRGPDAQQASLFGERDEYGVSYHGEHWDIDLGDRVFELSPLTEKRTLARGVGVRWRDRDTTVGMFALTTRFRRENSREFGAFVRQDFTPRFSLQANFLRKEGTDFATRGALPQNIATLESRYHFEKRINLRLEVGASRSDRGDLDFAYRAEARGELPGKLAYAIEHVHAGPDFRGYYSDTDSTHLSLTKTVTPALRLRASADRYAGNLALNDVRSSVVNRENSWTAGANYDWGKNTTLSAEWRHVERKDILEPAAYDFTSDAARLGVGQKVGPVHFQSFLDLGTLENAITGESGPFQRYSTTATWRATPRQTYSVFGSYGPSAFTGSTGQQLSAGAAAQWRVGDGIEASVSYARNQFDGITGREQDQALASVRYEFADKSALSILGRWSRAVSKQSGSEALNESAVVVSYAMPLRLPVSRKRSIGALQGRLSDSASGAGLPRVVLQIGERFAVTDDAGNFEFHELKPGACDLTVVRDSLSPRVAMVTPLPLKVRIRPADTTRVTLSAAPACTVAVRVQRYAFADGSSLATTSGALREAGGEEGIAIELSNGRDTWRAQTDRTGAASFDRLPAGAWTLRLAASDLPKLHTLEVPASDLTLSPGEAREVHARVLPQRRTLRMLESGTIQ